LGCLTVMVLRSQTFDMHLVSVLWTSDTLVAEAATYTTHSKHKRWTSMPSAEFKPVIQVIKQLQTYALDYTATGIGHW